MQPFYKGKKLYVVLTYTNCNFWKVIFDHFVNSIPISPYEFVFLSEFNSAGRFFIFYLPCSIFFFSKKLIYLLILRQLRSNLSKHFYWIFEIMFFFHHIFTGYISWNERGSVGVVFRLQRAQFNARPSM